MSGAVVRRLFCAAFLFSAAAISAVGAARADSPWFDQPDAPLPPVPHVVPFPLPGNPPVIFHPGLPVVALPGSNSRYGGMLPQVSTSSVDFDITEHAAPQASSTVPTAQQYSEMQFNDESVEEQN
jgi:hypothetical protein